MNNNPFADPEALVDYGLKAKDVDGSKKPPVVTPLLRSLAPPIGPSLSFTLDEIAAESGATKSQDSWILWYNQQGRVMASAANIYQAGKTGDRTLLASLQKDFLESWIVTSTRIDYDQNTLSSRITQYYGSTVRTPAATTIDVPVYNNAIATVLQDAQGLRYLQSLFNTSDIAEQIMQTLEKLSGKTRSEIKIWTPDQASRKSIPQRAVRFDLDSSEFRVVGVDRVGGNVGRSRGVR